MRIRTIKPEFWLHEDLSQLSPMARLAFIGLWQLADREGRLEDRPRRIKVSLFPYDNTEIEPLVSELEAFGFVQKYDVDGASYLSIPGFLEHQRPHPKEAQSLIPPNSSRVIKRRAVKGLATIPPTPGGREGKGMDNGKGREPKQTKPVVPPDPRHHETVKILVETFERIRRTKYLFAPRDAKAVSGMLLVAEPEEINNRLVRALNHIGWPGVNSLHELQAHFNAFTGAEPRKIGGSVIHNQQAWTDDDDAMAGLSGERG